jgi:hypothetical protein
LVTLGRTLGPHRVHGELLLRFPSQDGNAGLVYRVPMTSLYSSLELARYARFHRAVAPRLPAASAAYDLMAVRTIVTRRGAPGVIAAARALGLEGTWHDPRVARVDGVTWEVRNPLPRAYLPAAVRLIRHRPAQIAAMAALQPRDAVVVDQRTVACPSRAADPAAADAVEFLVDEPDRVRLRVRAQEAGPLVLSDTYYPGWRATIDGAPTPIARANLLFRMVCVPAGEHVVEFTFRQPGFQLGLALSMLSALGAVGLLVSPRWTGWLPAAPWRRGSQAAPAA